MKHLIDFINESASTNYYAEFSEFLDCDDLNEYYNKQLEDAFNKDTKCTIELHSNENNSALIDVFRDKAKKELLFSFEILRDNKANINIHREDSYIKQLGTDKELKKFMSTIGAKDNDGYWVLPYKEIS